MIRNVIFDLDGTLLDTAEGILESVAYTVKELGYKELTLEQKLSFIGPPVQASLKRLYGLSDEEAQRGANIFREYYKDNALLKAEPYEGIFTLCETLKKNNVKMSVATYKREDYALKLLCAKGFDRYCNPMHGADNNNILKKEDIVLMCVNEMGATKEECVLIGDTDNDAKGAAQAGIPFIAVTYGFGFKSRDDLKEYPHIGVASTPAGLAEIILA
ncbi:MAG: HAD hydrolase-like protein [Lachnospiraceae bacterium]|nr:HAD hydrolase-like protein [Lachnospiraceae bacterium]